MSAESLCFFMYIQWPRQIQLYSFASPNLGLPIQHCCGAMTSDLAEKISVVVVDSCSFFPFFRLLYQSTHCIYTTRATAMSEPNSGNKAILPLPFLLDASAAAPTHSLPHHVNTFRFGNMPIEEESFEQFDLSNPPPPPPAIHSNAQLQHRTPHTQPQPQQQQQQQTIESPPTLQGKRQLSTRNYKMYDGKTIFFCGGRFLTSRALWAFCISLFLVIMPSVLFLIFT